MSDNRREALEALRDKVADDWLTSVPEICGLPEMHVLAAYAGMLDEAKALHDAVMPNGPVNIWIDGEVNAQWGCSIASEDTVYSDCPARAWLLSILSALISETPKGETP